MLKRFTLIIGCFTTLTFTGCGTAEVAPERDALPSENSTRYVALEKNRHLNINILLDLSDRISPKINPKFPAQKDRDIAVVKTFCQAFKTNVEAFNAFRTQARMSVFFSPEPSNARVADIASKLNVACKAGNTGDIARQNKRIYQTLDTNFSTGLNQIYELAIQTQNFPGSNIFRFMKDEVKKCIEDTSVFRNILVILTDGYVYYENEKYNVGKRYSYIERRFEHFTRFRTPGMLEKDFDRLNYGFIKANDNLNGLEVLVLELSPPANFPIDYDIERKYWSKWLTEMGVKKFRILKTEQPVYTQKEISNFLANGK